MDKFFVNLVYTVDIDMNTVLSHLHAPPEARFYPGDRTEQFSSESINQRIIRFGLTMSKANRVNLILGEMPMRALHRLGKLTRIWYVVAGCTALTIAAFPTARLNILYKLEATLALLGVRGEKTAPDFQSRDPKSGCTCYVASPLERFFHTAKVRISWRKIALCRTA